MRISTPEAIVQAQLDAYNARDIDAFMRYWADDAQYFEFPNTLLASGAAQIRERHRARFQEPNLFGRLINRMVLGNCVVDHEHVTRTFPEGPGHVSVIAIYEVLDGKIAKAWFKLGPRVLLGGEKLSLSIRFAPPAWGNQLMAYFHTTRERFTPTRVGKSRHPPPVHLQLTVHPHPRGEICALPHIYHPTDGSPPPAWGNRKPPTHGWIAYRFTPTRVGKSHATHSRH